MLLRFHFESQAFAIVRGYFATPWYHHYFPAKTLHILPFETLLSPLTFLSTFTGWHIAIDLLFIAICGGLYTVPLYAIIQVRTTESHRARVIASNNIINALFMVIASIATMLMLKFGFTVLDVFLTIAIINVFFAIYICKLLPNSFFKSMRR